MRNRTDIMVIMVVMGVVSMLGLNFQLTSAMMARVEFGKGAGEYGVLGSILAIGSLTGALLAARRERPRVRLVIGAAFVFGLCMTIQAFSPNYLTYALLCIPVGFSSLTMLTAANATVQTSTDPAMRGRVMALYMVVLLGATPIGSPIVGWIAEAWGPRWAVGIGGVASMLVALAAALWAKRSWQFEVHVRRHSRPHLVVIHPEEQRAEAAARLETQDASQKSSTA